MQLSLTLVLIYRDSLGMNGIPITRPYLETLTSEELARWADHYGVDIPPSLDRIFVIEELLELTVSDIEIEVEEEYSGAPPVKFPVSAALPKQYNITFIETLVRDPLWAFVFWEVKGADRDFYENAPDFSGYCLKVSPWGYKGTINEVFKISLMPEDNARYLGFPPGYSNGAAEDARNRCYKVELFAELGGKESFLAASSPFRLPALSPRIEKQESPLAAKYPLLRLSGIEDFGILRNRDREPRIKRHGNSVVS